MNRIVIMSEPRRISWLAAARLVLAAVLIAQSYNLISLNEPTEAMRAVIAATRSVVFDEEP